MSTGNVSSFKVVLVGDAQVGKTSLLSQWAHGDFSTFYEPTVSPELTTKEVSVQSQGVRLQVWDIGFGEPDTVAQFPHFARGAAGVLLMYDLSGGSSVDGIVHWHEQVRSLTDPSCIFVVVGCKADLHVAPDVSQKARNFCGSLRLKHVETSAQSCSNTALAFETLAVELMQRSRGDVSQSIPVAAFSPPAPRVPTSTPVPVSSKMTNGQSAVVGRPVKLVLLGASNVGKSCLAQRLGGNEVFAEDYIPTAGPEILTQHVNVNGAPMKVQIWDVAGNDFLEDMRISHPVLRDLQAALVIYDVTSRESFEGLDRWFRLLDSTEQPDVAVMLIGHKADARTRTVSTEEGRAYAEAIRAPFAEVSSRANTGVSTLAEMLLAGGGPALNWEVAANMAPSSAISGLLTSLSPTASTNSEVALMAAPHPASSSPNTSIASFGGAAEKVPFETPAEEPVKNTVSAFAEKAPAPAPKEELFQMRQNRLVPGHSLAAAPGKVHLSPQSGTNFRRVPGGPPAGRGNREKESLLGSAGNEKVSLLDCGGNESTGVPTPSHTRAGSLRDELQVLQGRDGSRVPSKQLDTESVVSAVSGNTAPPFPMTGFDSAGNRSIAPVVDVDSTLSPPASTGHTPTADASGQRPLLNSFHTNSRLAPHRLKSPLPKHQDQDPLKDSHGQAVRRLQAQGNMGGYPGPTGVARGGPHRNSPTPVRRAGISPTLSVSPGSSSRPMNGALQLDSSMGGPVPIGGSMQMPVTPNSNVSNPSMQAGTRAGPTASNHARR